MSLSLSDEVLATSSSAATRIQATFRKYKVQQALLKAKILFNNIHNEIERQIGQSSRWDIL